MNNRTSHLPPEQEAIQAKLLGRSATFVELKKEEICHSIPAQFENIVRRYPHRVAVQTGDRALTYEQLNRAANRIGRAVLEQRGEGNEPIALLFDHGIEMIVAFLGILKAGKFCVSLSPTFPRERLSYIVNDSSAGLVITNSCNVDLIRPIAGSRARLLNVESIAPSTCSDDLGISTSPDDLAAIIYTSGSTGEPKGVINTHRSSLDKYFTYTNYKAITADDKLTLLHSLCFGSGEGDLMISLLNGACLFPFDMKSETIHALARLLKERGITVLHLPPSLLRQLGDALPAESCFSSVRIIQLSGAPITELDFEIFKKLFPPPALLEISMGSTETRGICAALVDHTFSFPRHGAPVGYPRRGKQVLLLDNNGREVGAGEIGEIAVKGRNLNVGYWRRPDFTGDKFLPDPHGGDERIYLTGDLGRKLPDGFVIHLGRKDLMVKIRGFRVELGEIEKALRAIPRVKDAAVAPWDRRNGEKSLVAYIVRRYNAVPTSGELRRLLKEKLPDYMIPSTFVFLEALPLTNGKLDRKALPEPGMFRPELDTPYAAPRTPTEAELARVWAEVLFLDNVGIHDNFFDLGGHSLAATRVVSQIIKHFQIEIPLRSLFQSPTIAEMAAVIIARPGKKLGDEELAGMLAEIESMSDEDAQRLLNED
jgi:amino acid adenylation domain-containing protein